MPTFHDPDPVACAGEVREALRGLAHAARSIEDPTVVYPILGDISSALASLSQSLHQLADAQDGAASQHALVEGDRVAGRAAAYQASWELHRAGEMVHQVAEAVNRAHEIDARIAHTPPGLTPEPTPGLTTRPRVVSASRSLQDRGLSL